MHSLIVEGKNEKLKQSTLVCAWLGKIAASS